MDDDKVFGTLRDNLHVAAGVQGSGSATILITLAAQMVYKMASENKFYLWVLKQDFVVRKFL